MTKKSNDIGHIILNIKDRIESIKKFNKISVELSVLKKPLKIGISVN